MSIRNLVFAACAALFAWPCLAAPLEAYGRLPNIEVATVSPDGAYLAVIQTNGEQRRILMKNLGTGEMSGVLVGEAKVRDLDWADSRHLLITTSTTARIMNVIAPRDEWRLLFSYDVETKKLHHLLRDIGGGLNVLAGTPSLRTVAGEPLVFAEGIKFDSMGRGRVALFKIELKRGTSKLVHAGFPDTRDWLVGPDGEPMAESEYDGRTGRWSIRVKEGAGWREIKSGRAAYSPTRLRGLGRDGKSMLVVEDDGEETKVHEVSAAGEWGEEVLESDASPIRDPVGHHLIGYSRRTGEELGYTFFDPRDQRAWNAVRAAFPKDAVTLQSWSDNRRKLVVLVDSPTEGPAYSLVDLDARKATWIGGEYEGVEPGELATVRPIRFKAADGLDLSGYLTTPNGRLAKALPLVVLPHGGPASRDTAAFDWWSQALASRGYAVLQVNFRGSDGMGREFLEAGFGQWGRKMQTDLSDGVRHLTAQGVIDPKRVCIVGASYGGYAALAGPSLDPGVYRCAASVAGLSDLTRFVAWTRDQNGASSQRYWTRFMGTSDPKDAVLGQISPANHVDKINAPILLIHGRDDTVVPFSQSAIMAEALTKAGKPVDLVTLPGEDHWLSRGETRLQMLNAIVAFLEKHNPPT
ncbi:S9 family peptidase [Phenylobacterium sp.]|uniref:alpha/beta hydrolase family protein n=1 Tax=Phenylobacterium sp. TaxID=1871053 RepID=UPI0027370796|nr:S9 family peptidase [Phenylobacterium sp.]MDP3854133.1 S9 family peptidase [Phenylobacterium sp.]